MNSCYGFAARLRRVGLGLVLLGATGWGQAGGLPQGRSLAVELGCVNCHGLRGEAPSLDRLAQRLAKYQGRSEEAARLADHLRDPNAGHRVVAHERLSTETATRLMQWLIDGAP